MPACFQLTDAYAPPGLVGLETALGLTIAELVVPGHLGLADALALLSSRPAAILGLERQGSLAEGAPANLAVFDPERRWRVDPALFLSRSRNTPFAGRELQGRVLHTFFEGRPVVREGELLSAAPV